MLRLLSLILILNLTLAPLVKADCYSTLDDCAKTIAAGKVVIDDQATQIANYSKQNELNKQVIADQNAQLRSPLNDPVKVTGVAVLATVLALVLTGHVK